MNLEHLNIAPKHTKSSREEIEQFAQDLRMTLAMAKQGIPKGKKFELRFGGLPVLNYTIRPGGLLAIELLDAATKSARLVLLDYRHAVFECLITNDNQNQRLPRPEIGFHAIFPAAKTGKANV